jgi:hypothetical protein
MRGGSSLQSLLKKDRGIGAFNARIDLRGSWLALAATGVFLQRMRSAVLPVALPSAS